MSLPSVQKVVGAVEDGSIQLSPAVYSALQEKCEEFKIRCEALMPENHCILVWPMLEKNTSQGRE